MLPVSRCNTVGFRLLLSLYLLILSWQLLTPAPSPLAETLDDKLLHAVGFLLLAFLTDASWPEKPFNWIKVLPLAGYGVLIEFIQHYAPNRFFSVGDILADWAGIGLYLLLIPLIARLMQSGADRDLA